MMRRASVSQTIRTSDEKEGQEHLYDPLGRALNPLQRASRFSIYREPTAKRRTGIICTIGPKTQTVEGLLKLRKAGMNILRMNFSHGSYEFHGTTIANLRRSFEVEPGAPVAIALDTKGPEIRTGLLKDDKEITIEAGSSLVLTTDEKFRQIGDQNTIFVDYVTLPKTVKEGGIVYIDDGLLSLKVVKIEEHSVQTVALNTAKLGSKKGVNLPNVQVDLPATSEKDRRDLEWGVEQGIDMVFASFIRKKQDVIDVRAALGKRGRDVRIIAKIENHEGIQKFDEILAEADGIMVARGDLGIEIPVHKVFLAQKMMISRSNIAGKPVICATQMLESMTFNPRPTRAEVTDVANAVLDGADCVMLSGETAKGAYFEEATKMMHEICLEAESAFHHEEYYKQLREVQMFDLTTQENVAACAVAASLDGKVAAILVVSLSGESARLVAKYRPACPILVATTSDRTSRCVHLHRSCYPIKYNVVYDQLQDYSEYLDKLIAHSLKQGLLLGHVKPGDSVVVVQGWMEGKGHTNTMRIVKVEA